MKKCSFVIVLVLLVVSVAILNACAKPSPLPPQSAPGVTLTPTSNSELEAKVKQLEAENQRLLAENQRLSSDLARITRLVQNLKLAEIQTDASELAAFLEGLPELPALPPGLTVSQIDDAINRSRDLREMMEALPPLPPLTPELRELEEARGSILAITEWMESLEDLPAFMRVAGDLDQLRVEMIAYLTEIQTTMSALQEAVEEALEER